VPLISYLIFGGNLSDTNIYGLDDTGQVFVSNHYGWSSALYILSFIYVFRNIKVKKYFLFLIISILVVALILLFSSANRASLISVALSVFPLVFRYKGIKRWYKVAFIIVFAGLLFYLLNRPDSAINFLIEKSKNQEAEGETRFKITALMLNYFNNNPLKWITGIGIFNYGIIRGKTNVLTYHNSYWEILFGLGLPLFFMFLTFMVFRPLYRFIRVYSKYTLLFIPLLIIPYFESNLTAGQFLFFPWFTYMLLLNAKFKYWNKRKVMSNVVKNKISIYPGFSTREAMPDHKG
jgi:O-antigen ligase